MNKYSKQLLRIGFLAALFVAGMNIQHVAAQGDSPNGNSNLYYNSQYNSGVYNNPQYDNYNLSYNDFYENLAPYGQWIEDPQYGYVWSPNVDMTFRPYYTNGYWAMTEYGNTWVSQYDWGWACFHYGRWTFDSYYGWLWVPGMNWGPAWVSWRYGNGYYGWAPLAPGYEFTNSSFDEYACPRDWYVFIPCQYIYTGSYYRFWSGAQGTNNIYKQTIHADNTYVTNNITYVSGPRTKDIEATTHKPVQVFHLNNTGGPRVSSVHNGVIKMFRPAEIRQTTAEDEHVTPPNVIAAPQTITTKPHSVNSTAGATPAFRNDMPASNTPVMIHAIPAKQDNTPKTAERADKFSYQSDVTAQDAQIRRQQQNSAATSKPAALPQQRPQAPEPIRIPQRRPTPLPAPTQHADPIPAAPEVPKPAPRVVPVQHPEGVEPSGKR